MTLLESSVIAMFGILMPFFIFATYLAYRARARELAEDRAGVSANTSKARSADKTIVFEIRCVPAREGRRGRFGRKTERMILQVRSRPCRN